MVNYMRHFPPQKATEHLLKRYQGDQGPQPENKGTQPKELMQLQGSIAYHTQPKTPVGGVDDSNVCLEQTGVAAR
jgi:hypothetical protein